MSGTQISGTGRIDPAFGRRRRGPEADRHCRHTGRGRTHRQGPTCPSSSGAGSNTNLKKKIKMTSMVTGGLFFQPGPGRTWTSLASAVCSATTCQSATSVCRRTTPMSSRHWISATSSVASSSPFLLDRIMSGTRISGTSRIDPVSGRRRLGPEVDRRRRHTGRGRTHLRGQTCPSSSGAGPNTNLKKR